MNTLATYPKEMRPFEPRGNAIAALKSRRREVVLSGPAGTGKSTTWLQKFHICARKYAHMRGLIVRKTRHSLTQSAMVTFEQKVLPEGWLEHFVHFRTQEQQYEYTNGSVLAVAGMDKVSKVMSSEWDIIYVMEATELMEDDWEALSTRLRNGIMPYQQLCGDCNPGPPNHWLKLRADRGVTLMLESRHEDNPACTQEYLATLDALTGVRYLRLRKGIWAAAEGMVYDEWDRSKHIVDRATLQSWGVLRANGTVNPDTIERVIAGVDWGFTNPGVIQVYGIDGDERLYLLREIYCTQKTIDWWIAQAQALRREFPIDYFICDPSEPSYIAQFNEYGLSALKATNDIAPGISALQSRLRTARDGRPRFFVYEYALQERDERRVASHDPYCFEQEIDAYVWPQSKDGQPVKEVPVKVNDHAMDCARYICMRLERVGTPLAGDEPSSDANAAVLAAGARAAAVYDPAVTTARTREEEVRQQIEQLRRQLTAPKEQAC